MSTVLIVDDLATERRMVGGLLERTSTFALDFAANGIEALDRMQQARPDVVLTDLQMPEMDGLELVRSIQSRFPTVPVVLMTSYGSEAIAVEALESGAASYVPKTQLMERLRDTLDRVISLAAADRNRQQLMQCLAEAHLSFELENDPKLVYPLVEMVQQSLEGSGVCDSRSLLQVGVALEEAILNALYHGNLDLSAEELEEASASLLEGNRVTLLDQRRQESPYCDRRLQVEVTIDANEARFIIRDQGEGFNFESVPDPTSPENLTRSSGRGLLLMRTFMDEVSYNELGNEVLLRKCRNGQAAQPAQMENAEVQDEG